MHQQWSLNKTAPRERVVDSKKLVPEKKPNLETMAPVPGMFDVFLNHTAAAAIGFFIVAFSTIVFAGHFSAREVDRKKLVPEKKPNLETMAAVPGEFDVFLNHRGPDVKGGFASHLRQALQEARCRPFLDKRLSRKGKMVKRVSTWSRELIWLQWMNSNLSALPLKLNLRKLMVFDLTSNKELMQIWPNDLEV